MTKPTISTFNKIAPLSTHEYERYLPTAFDPSLSMLEKINKSIQKMFEVGEITNAVVEQWNTVMEWVMSDGLTESVKIKIGQMFQDGEFNEIISGLWGDAYNYASADHDAKSGAILDIPDIMQTVVYDKIAKCLYVAYEDQQQRFSTETLIIAKLDTTGRVIGEMFFNGFGHGDGMFIDVTQSENIVLNLEKNGEYKTVRVAFSLGRTYHSFSELTVITQFNGQNWKTGFNEDLSTFALINPSLATQKVNIYKRNLFAIDSSLPAPDLTITLDPSAKPYQGIAVGRKSVFVLTGTDANSSSINLYPHTLWEYSIEDGSLVKRKPLTDFVSRESSNGYSEPEGLQIVLDEYFSEILLVGYARGPFRQRINEIYELGAKGTNSLTRRIPKGFYRENGAVKKRINDENFVLADLYEAGAYYVSIASDAPTGRQGFLYNDVSFDGVNILQRFVSNIGIQYTRWIYWTNSVKTVTDWQDVKTNVNFGRTQPVDATYANGVSKGSFFIGLRTYKEYSPLGHRAFLEGAFLIDSSVLPITGGYKHIATVTADHAPYYKIPLSASNFAQGSNNVLGYIDTDGKIYIQGSGATGGYYTFGTTTYPVPAS